MHHLLLSNWCRNLQPSTVCLFSNRHFKIMLQSKKKGVMSVHIQWSNARKSLFELYLISRVCWKLSVSVLFFSASNLQWWSQLPAMVVWSIPMLSRRPISQIYPMHIPKKSPLPSGYLLHSPWKDPPFLIGKPSISMGHLYHGYVK